MAKQLPDYITIGFVEKAHGIKGELKVRPLTDHPTRFKGLTSLQIEQRSGVSKVGQIEHVAVRGDIIYLKLAEVDSRDDAHALKGAYLNIRREEALPLADGEFYFFEVLGFEVLTREGKRLGRIEEVMDMPANAVLRVKAEHKESLIPVIPSVMHKVDKQRQQIIINVIEGLLD